MDEMPQSRNGWKKLRNPPLAVTIYLDYKEDPDYRNPEDPEERRYIPDPMGTVVKGAWLHPLTRDQVYDKEGIAIEALRRFLKKTGSKAEAVWVSNRVEACQLLAFSLKVSDDPESKPLMDDDEVAAFPRQEVDRLSDLYFKNFVPTKEERKNCLRERLGQVLGTESSSPSPLTAAASSSQKE